MLIHDLKPNKGAVKVKKRVGRGPGSGLGKTSGRGQKGDGARSGSKKRAWFEGGQTPLHRRLPKRGFSNALFKKEYQIVNVGVLNDLFDDGEEIDILKLYDFNLIKNLKTPVKILGNGDVNKKFTLIVDAISESAKEKIEKAGGKVVLTSQIEIKQEVEGDK